MEVRIWKNGKPLDYSGKSAITALAILFMEKEIRLGIIKRNGSQKFTELVSEKGQVIGNVSYSSEDEYETIYALSVAGRVRRELKKRKEEKKRRIAIKTARLN